MLLLLGEGILLWGIVKQKIYIRYWGVLQLLYYHNLFHKCSQMLQYFKYFFMHFAQNKSLSSEQRAMLTGLTLQNTVAAAISLMRLIRISKGFIL